MLNISQSATYIYLVSDVGRFLYTTNESEPQKENADSCLSWNTVCMLAIVLPRPRPSHYHLAAEGQSCHSDILSGISHRKWAGFVIWGFVMKWKSSPVGNLCLKSQKTFSEKPNDCCISLPSDVVSVFVISVLQNLPGWFILFRSLVALVWLSFRGNQTIIRIWEADVKVTIVELPD